METDHLHNALTDGGYKSRKLWACGVTALLLLIAFALCGFFPALVAGLGEICWALTCVLGLYLGANVSGKWSLARALAPQPDEQADGK